MSPFSPRPPWNLPWCLQLPVHWAFVIQCWADTPVDQGFLAGQGEHGGLGHAPTFQSPETLLAFIAQVPRAERERSADHNA